MAPPLLQLTDIGLTFGGTPLLERASLSAMAGDRIALIGRNGSGKSTLLKIAAGMIEPQEGEIFRQPTATVRYLPQTPDMEGFDTVHAYVEAGLGPADDPHRVTYLLDHLGLTGEESPATLSGGEARRASLARVLAPRARYPAARRADQPSRPVDDRMAGRGTGALVFAPSSSSRTTGVFWSASAAPPSGSTGAARCASTRGSPISKNGATRCWKKKNATSTSSAGRSCARSTGCAMASPPGASATCAGSATCRRMRQEFRTHRGAEGLANMAASDAAESGKLVIEARNIGKSFDGRDIVRDFSTRIQRGDRIGTGRAERRRQDDAAQDADRRTCARYRQRTPWCQPRDRHARPEARSRQSEGNAGALSDRRARRDGHRQWRGAPRRLVDEGFPVQAGTGAHAGARTCRAANGRGSSWRGCCRSRRTFSCSTNRPTISTWRRWTCCRNWSRVSPAPSSWSAMTATSSTVR